MESSQRTKRKLSPAKAVLFSLILVVGSLAILEIGARLMFAYVVGPSVLLYGTPFERQTAQTTSWEDRDKDRTATQHDNEQDGYSKYFPNQTRYEADARTGERFSVKINKDGFRGEDFSIEREPGTRRIVTLGASSTFGFHARDEETYPFQLEKILNAESEQTYEVINLGVPHLYVENIWHLFQAEALPLNPDIITFYEGNNDAALVMPILNEGKTGFLYTSGEALAAAGRYSVILGLVGHSVNEQLATNRYQPEKIEAAAEVVSEDFFATLQQIADECERRGIVFIVASQQRRSLEIESEDLKGVTYQEERDIIRDRLREGQGLNQHAIKFVAHAVLMDQIGDWASANDIPFVDVIPAMDQRRDFIATQVHLDGNGNRVVAEELAKQILQLDEG